MRLLKKLLITIFSVVCVCCFFVIGENVSRAEGAEKVAQKVTLSGRQDFVLDGDADLLDLGEYNGLEILSVKTSNGDTLDGISTATARKILTDKQKHGELDIIVTVIKADGTKVEITVPVTVITKVITTMSDLQDSVKHIKGADNIYGYYVLGNDVSYKEVGFTFKNASYGFSTANAFRGTFDGRGYTVNYNSSGAAYGLFGTINRATIKNVTIIDAWNSGGSLIAYNAYNLILENVNISVTGGKVLSGQNGSTPFFGYTLSVSTLKKVTISSSVAMKYVFATQNRNSFEEVLLDAVVTEGFSITDKVFPLGVKKKLNEGQDLLLDDTRERVIDLGITDGNINTAQTYDLNVDGLTEANFVSVGYGGKTLTTDGLTIKTSEFGKVYGKGELEIKYIYDGKFLTHKLPVLFVTKVLNTANDLKSFAGYADAYDGATNNGVYDGYFTLGKDIDYNGTFVPSMITHTDKIGDKTLGFRGVFDGRGYTVNGMCVESANWSDDNGTSTAYRRTGFISVLHKDGVIKNVAFTNAKVKYCSYLASWGEGIIENVFVGYTGNTADAWNSTVNTVRDGVPAVTMRNCVISYDTAWSKGYILGKVNDSAAAYQNVYLVGPSTDNLISYYSNLQNKDGVTTSVPFSKDNFACYNQAAEMLAERKNEINAWNYFSASNTSLSFGSKTLFTASAAATPNYDGNVILSADKTSSDYTIIYEDGNEYALKAAGFISEHLRRASGSVTYTGLSGGRFAETINGGINLKITTQPPATWSDSSAYIVIGGTDIENAPKADYGRYIIKTVGNTAFINANMDEEYITAAIAFLEQTIGYNALSDDTVLYEKIDGATVIMPDIDIDYDSAFNLRNSTNAHHVWKNEQLGLNGRERFPIGPADENEEMQPVHNTIYWLNYSENKTLHPAWFRTTSSGISDICYAAGGAQNSSNAEYVAMVNYAANEVRNLLDAYPSVTDLTFSLSDGDLEGCQCSVCSSNHTDAAVKFLNDVVLKIQSLDGNAEREFTIYLFAYYYLCNAPTITMNDHLGILYAPVRNGYEATSIYSCVNNSVRNQISAWVAKTKNIGFWFYGTLFHNYMIPTDTVKSLLTWFEFSARTVKAAGGEPAWIYVNGQTRERGASAFEAFKQYAFSKAQVEILENVNRTDNATVYYQQLDDYVLELESKFFAFTVNGTTKTFRDGGYFGAAKANEAMYNLYLQMKTDYANIKRDGTTYEYIDAVTYSGTPGITKTANRLCDYLTTGKTDGYWKYFTSDMIKKYMGYIETAQSAIASYGGDMKTVYERHILIESLTPRFLLCVAGGSSKSGYGFSGGYKGVSISYLRKNLKSDFNLLGREYYGEHYKLSDLYSNWGI